MTENLPVIKPKITREQLIEENPGAKVISYLIPAVFFDCGSFNLLVELTGGGVVADVDSGNVIKIPGLDEISMNELAILEQGFQLGEFKPADISLGINDHKVESILSDLLKKKLVTISNMKYKVTDRFKILYNTQDYATNAKIEYESVEGTKLDAKISVAQIRERIESMVKVYKEQECWVFCHKLQ